MHQVTVDELRTVHALKDLPDEHLQWILDRSSLDEWNDGDTVWRTGEPANDMMILLEGQVSFYMDVNGRLVYYFTFGNDETTGGVSGLLPYSRMVKSPGNSYAVGNVRALRFNKEHFPELERMNPALIQKLIGYMTERARAFATHQLQQEKVSALGKLAAGIAHELNNPAAAINRISAELEDRIKLNFSLTEKLLYDCVMPQQFAKVHTMYRDFSSRKQENGKVSTMARMQAEDDISDWLEDHNIPEGRQMAETFSETGMKIEHLESIYEIIGEKGFLNILSWLENESSARRAVKDLEDASTRISHLVGAIKSHVHMDRTNDMQRTNIHNDIDNTLILLGYKLRQKNIAVKKKFAEDVPDVPAYVSELNQVWTNLIDNAIYAMPQNGELTIETCNDQKNVRVRVMDNGSGIPKDIQSRIFDPFFTTKKVGDGTGIGLDLVKRIVTKHNGDVKVFSEPGRTEFSVCIPKQPVVREAAK